MNTEKDKIYASALQELPAFEFDAKVASVFPDMIKRSVPGYGTILQIIGQLTERYAQENSNCYELGCSLGAGILAMRSGLDKHKPAIEGSRIIGVDNSKAMIERCKEVVALDTGKAKVELLCEDICDTEIQNASICVLNFTLQFVEIEKRQALLKRICDNMKPGGILLLSEKIAFENESYSSLMIDLHHNFKRMNGYSDLEIAQKRDSIENVLIPEPYETHKNRLNTCGFSQVNLWFQCFNFSSIIAFK